MASLQYMTDYTCGLWGGRHSRQTLFLADLKRSAAVRVPWEVLGWKLMQPERSDLPLLTSTFSSFVLREKTKSILSCSVCLIWHTNVAPQSSACSAWYACGYTWKLEIVWDNGLIWPSLHTHQIFWKLNTFLRHIHNTELQVCKYDPTEYAKA